MKKVAKAFPYMFLVRTRIGTDMIEKVEVPLPDVAPRQTIDRMVSDHLKVWMWLKLDTSWEILDQIGDKLQLKFKVATDAPNSLVEEIVELEIPSEAEEVAEMITDQYQGWVERHVETEWEPIIY